jgi:signal transduction histidine kinase
MKSLRARLTIWFAASLVLVLVVFVAFTYHVLDSELRAKSWRRDYPEHPDWKLHGSFSEAEVQDVLGELLGTSLRYGIPLAVAALGLGYWLARKSVRPITRVNEQLANIRAQTLSQRIALAEVDDEFRDLVRHINELLARLDKSFTDMSDYAAKVAHELRTPLAILRLKVEQAGPQIPPDFAETIQAELHQLCHVVDQSLLIAKAEQGRLVLHPEVFDLAHLVSEVAEDFVLLAQEDLGLGGESGARLPAQHPAPARRIELRRQSRRLPVGARGFRLQPAGPLSKRRR